MNDKKARVRCNNYSANEMEALLCLAEKHQHVIECKKTDVFKNKEKDEQWEKIAVEFNAITGIGRTAKQLRSKWDSWKKSVKKEHGDKKCDLYKTGGGPHTTFQLSPWGERILAIIGVGAAGTVSMYDSDNNMAAIPNNTDNVLDIDQDPNLVIEIIEANKAIEDIENDTHIGQDTEEIDNWMADKNITNTRSDEDLNIENTDAVCVPIAGCSTHSQKTAKPLWKDYSPSMLRQPVSRELICRKDLYADEGLENPESVCSEVTTVVQSPKIERRGVQGLSTGSFVNRNRIMRRKQVKPKTTNNSSLQHTLLEKKLELVQLQIDIMKREHEEKERRLNEKHEFEMELLKKEKQ